jgi:hypothetical protein
MEIKFEKRIVILMLCAFVSMANQARAQVGFPGVTCTNQRLAPLTGVASAPYGTKNSTLSANGNYLSFTSESPDFLTISQQTINSQIYLFDRNLNNVKLLSESTTGQPGNGASDNSFVSSSGTYVSFDSRASNLEVGDTNGTSDVFLAIPSAQAVFRVSTDSQGNQLSGNHFKPSVSENGRVLFISTNDQIVPGDNNGATDVFLKDLNGSLYRISKNGAPISGIANTNMPILYAEISADGQAAIYSTQTNILGENNLNPDIFYVDLSQLPNIPTPIPVSSGWANPGQPAGGAVWGSISGDGQRVVFSSTSALHVQGDIADQRDDLFVWEKSTRLIRKINPPLAPQISFAPSLLPKISFNGRWVSILGYSWAWDSTVTREEKDTILYDLETDRYEIVSRYAGGTGLEDEAVATTTSNPGKSVSDDGKTIVFETESNRVISNYWTDQNARTDVFMASCTMPDYPTVCSGDGSSGLCPFSVLGGIGAGCPNSVYYQGARLDVTGFAQISDDTLKLKISGLPPGSAVCLAASLPNTVGPSALGYGLKCIADPYVAGFSVIVPPSGRVDFGYGSRFYPNLGAVLGMPLTTVTYQAFYLDSMMGLPPATPVNSTNAVNVFWRP